MTDRQISDIITFMKEYLFKAADACGISLSEDVAEKLERFYLLLMDWNQRMNLTAITEAKDAALKHFVDSLSAAKFIPEGATVADVGSGAGFPGIPLKIYRPDIKPVLMDSLNKRVCFLQEAITVLDLKETEAVHIRAEDAGKGSFREQFDVATARAVARLNLLCEYCLPLVKVGGVFIAYKTKDPLEISEAKRAVELLGSGIEKTVDFNLGEIGRQLIIIRKIKSTPERYPRDAGKIKKSPL